MMHAYTVAVTMWERLPERIGDKELDTSEFVTKQETDAYFSVTIDGKTFLVSVEEDQS